MKGMRRILSVAAASLLLLGIPAGPPASGQEETALLGYSIGGTATAISTLYNQPSFGVPQDPTFEARKVYSVATLDTGPSGRGMGSVLWPGDVAGNAPPALIFDSFLFNPTQLDELDETCFEQIPAPPEEEEPGPEAAFRCSDPDSPDAFAFGIQSLKRFAGEATKEFPPYPIRAESFYPPGGIDDSDPRMRSRAAADRTEGSSTLGGEEVPSLISFGSLGSSSLATIEKDVAISESRSSVADLDFLGVLHVDNILAVARTTSDGIKAKTDSTLQITGLTISDPRTGEVGGQIIVDETGFHAGDENRDPFGVLAEALFDKYLAPNGIHLAIGGAIGRAEGAAASLGVTGLIVGLDAYGMKTLIDSMPDEIRSLLLSPSGATIGPVEVGRAIFGERGPSCQTCLLSPTLAGFLTTFFQGDQTMQFVFGTASANSAASPPLPPFTIPDVPDFPPLLPGGISPPVDFGTGGTEGFTQPGTGGGGTVLGTRPVGVLGVPASLLGLVLLAGLLGARYLRTLADRLTTAKVVARCPLEESS